MSGRGDGLRVEVDGPVATVTLDRPSSLNALTRGMLHGLLEVVDQCRRSDSVRVLVLHGEGRMFSAGVDVAEIGDGSGQVRREQIIADARLGDRLCSALESPELVTIAAVHGRAVGGAAAIVSSCDLRLLAEDACLVLPELAMGLPLAWGGVERLIRDLGPTVVRDLLLTGRPLAADEALSRGFATAVVAPDQLLEHARRNAELIASRPAVGVTATLNRILAITNRRDAAGNDDDALTLADAAVDPDVAVAIEKYLADVAQRTSTGRASR